MNWSPILDGDLTERSTHAIQAILHDLREGFRPEWAPGEVPQELTESSLGSGAAGLALLFYYANAAGISEDDEVAIRYLDQAIDAVANVQMPPGLYMGFTGIAWAVSHLQGRLFQTTSEDPNEDIDEALESYLSTPGLQSDYDLISGLVGFGVYALERLPRPSARRCLAHIVDRLEESARKSDEGLSWWTSPMLLPPETRERFPEGYFNLGVAHGVPAVVALLGKTIAAGVSVESARELFEGAVAWTLAHRLPDGAGGVFPTFAGTKEPSRLAWCYGDAGAATALMVGARAVADKTLEKQATEIALAAAARSIETSGVLDAPICHGSAGLAHLFNRLYQAVGLEPLRVAARSWVAHALDEQGAHGPGIGGFSAWGPKTKWTPDPGFLSGSCGIGLVLLSAAFALEPEWDRILLADVPLNPS